MLESFFNPESVAVIGASRTPGKVGHDIVRNLKRDGFAGPIYPVNPKADEVVGLKCYPSVTEVEGDVELAVISIPARFVPETIDQCAEQGVRAVIVISAGFKESGEEGARLEEELLARCRAHGIRCLGPNCLGVMSPPTSMNASFGVAMPKPGNIAFISQSGALGTAILDISVGQDFGMSRFVSIGNKADVDETDLIAALGGDEQTDVILAYLESIDDGQRFMETAERVTRRKPVVVFKSGRTSAGARAASSHTGSLAGSDSAYDAGLAQCGVVRARSVLEFFDLARAFGACKWVRRPGVAVVTNAGGPGIIATDAISSSPLSMARLSEETRAKLLEALPPQASVENPVDVLGDAPASLYRVAMTAVEADPDVGSILAILTPQTSTEVEATAESVADTFESTEKAVTAAFMGSASVRTGWDLLDDRGVPNFAQPDRAVTALEALYRYGRWLQADPEAAPDFAFDDEAIAAVIAEARAAGRATLGERPGRRIAEACGIPIPPGRIAADEDQAVQTAGQVGYPVVLKISSEDILHKSDAGGVIVGLEGEDEVRETFRRIIDSARRYKPDAEIDGVLVQKMAPQGREVIIGVNRDPQFGPVVMFGLGGIYVEVLKDVVFRVAPLSPRDAREMITGIRAARILGAFRGEPAADTEAIADCLMRVSALAVRFPELVECDLNPLMVYPEGDGAIAVDVRFGLAEGAQED